MSRNTEKKPLLLVFRGNDSQSCAGADSDDFKEIYRQMDKAIGAFVSENGSKLDVIYQKLDMSSPKGNLVFNKNAFAIVVLGDNVISYLQSEQLPPNIPIITSVSGYRSLQENNTFHFWPFVLPVLAYLAAEWIARNFSDTDKKIYIVTDKSAGGGVLKNVFLQTLIYLGMIDENEKDQRFLDEADEKRLEKVSNESAIIYISGIGSIHDKALARLIENQKKNGNLYIISDQSISDPGRTVPLKESIQYFTILLEKAGRLRQKNEVTVSPFTAENKFSFFVYQTVNLVWGKFVSYLKLYGNSKKISFGDFLRATKTYIYEPAPFLKNNTSSNHDDYSNNLFISDNGQLYAPLYVAHGERIEPVRSQDDSDKKPLDIAYLLQIVDEQLKYISYLDINGENDDVIEGLRLIGRQIASIFDAQDIAWIGECFKDISKSDTSDRIMVDSSTDSLKTVWCSNIIELFQHNSILTGAIQITLGANFELPDNDAIRAYFDFRPTGEQSSDKPLLLPASLLWRNGGFKGDNEEENRRTHHFQFFNNTSEIGWGEDLDSKTPTGQGCAKLKRIVDAKYANKNIVSKEVQHGIPQKIIFSKYDLGGSFDEKWKGGFWQINDADANTFLGICSYLFGEQCKDASDEAYLYIFPEILPARDENESERTRYSNNWLLFVTKKRLSYLDLRVLTNVITRVAHSFRNAISSYKIRFEATRSAIGSIMSRNGSHNIGSHVLAALSHNVGTMPDDRVLYQYIQHRMDYIATATTDFPIWSQPLPFVGNVIKNFLIQRHLLDHITGSEGLHAYQFQNDKVPTSAKENSDSKTICQPKTIRIHARRIKDDMNWNELTHFKVEEKDFIDFIPYPTGDYEDESCKESLLSNDVEVAIPGGVVGRHAFYTIVENVLRNAAKHEWSKLEDENRKSACLDVFVDFKDNPSKGIVEIVIWTDSEYSMRHYAMEQFKNPNGLDRKRIKNLLDTETGSGTLNLDGLEEHQKLQVKMARSFIAEDGQLRKENWGLAEMRISAGYLNVADIADIGGISTSDLRFELIKPVMIQNGEHYCLGYHFDIPKPKELLIVVPESAGVDEKTMRDAHAMLMQYGVGVMSENDVFEESCKKENSAKLSYAYILLKDFKKKDGAISDVVDKDDMRTWKLPFRVVTESKTELNPEDNKSVDRRADYVFSDNKNVFDSTSQKLYALTTSKEEAKSFATAVLSDVYRSWVQHLKKEHYNNNPDAEIILAIDVNREAANDKVGKKGGKDLVSDADLLKVLFEICFDKAVDSFIQIWETNGNKPCQDKENGDKYCQGEDIDVRLKVTLEQMKKMCPREVAIEPSRVIKPESDTDGGEKEITIVFTTRQLLRQQLIKWCVCIDSDNVPNDVLDSVRDVWEDLCDENENLKNKSDIVGLDAFLDYLEYSVLPQTKVFLSMYEECFVTLPKSITVAKEISEGTTITALDNQKIEAAITEDEKKELLKYDERLIAYWRHENFETERDCRYLEPLSGAQSYLAAFECLKEESIERTRFVTKLIENGLVRILIIDERAKKFSDEHSEVKKVFDHIGIAVLDDKCPQVESIFSGEGNLDDVVGGEKVRAYDVLVIHQGIIDKKLKDHGNADKIRKFIEGLKRKIRYVVVTTGRGSPANIPPEVRVLPFSVIESTLFRKYPEKMILVDAIMNTLPLARKERS